MDIKAMFIRNNNKRLCRYYFNPGAFKKDVKKMVTLANGKTEQEKLSEDWQRVSDDFARACKDHLLLLSPVEDGFMKV